MRDRFFDVIIIGAGPAGVAAAGALAGSGISTALIEAGAYAGAENWSGCVYFTESLAAPDCFGPAALAAAPFERTVVRRGTLMHNGLDVVGIELTDPDAFRHCYTVLRPVYDPYFADLARRKGAVLLTGTTVTSLIRRSGRVAGVETNRGPLQAGVVFIAEGDASHLVRSEGLERTREPHYLQGVKAVLNLPSAEIDKRFNLAGREGAAYEIVMRNAVIGGRTAKLNAGGFLYTNRDSLSVGYVAPLDNLRKNYRGDHDRLFEWMRGLPVIGDLVKDATLSAYGAKIIRSGGWRERPVLVEDGLAVGGASANLGIDIPFPNFTGPAAASGLYFARAVKALLGQGKSLDAKNLRKAYLEPLQESVYGRNARDLSRWPRYFSGSGVLFGRTVDMACGAARFLSTEGFVETARFLRGHLLSVRAARELLGDALAMLGALRLWKPLAAAAFHPKTWAAWLLNSMPRRLPRATKLAYVIHVAGRRVDAFSLPWPFGALLTRLSPGLSRAVTLLYANDDAPALRKIGEALGITLRSFSAADAVTLPATLLALMVAGLATAISDAFRFYVLKTPVEKMLAGPVMAYNEAQRKARDLDAVKLSLSFDAKLATNTYRVGAVSHIRTLWPDALAAQPDFARAGLWWVCPARVYGYDAPLFGRGAVSVSYENCIKCESCWRAEPARTLWGRFTDHSLIYRPESSALALLLSSLAAPHAATPAPAGRARPALQSPDEQLWYLGPAIRKAMTRTLASCAAFRDAVARLPRSADLTRRSWPAALAARLDARLSALAALFSTDGRPLQATELSAFRAEFAARVSDGRLFHLRYHVAQLEDRLRSWTPLEHPSSDGTVHDTARLPGGELAARFPDRVVKQWEEAPMPEEWARTLRDLIAGHNHPARPLVRALSGVSPALGLIAASHSRAARVLRAAGRAPEPGICAVDGPGIAVATEANGYRLSGTLALVPVAAATTLLVIVDNAAYLVPVKGPGTTIAPSPAIGFRAAGMVDVVLDAVLPADARVAADGESGPDALDYLAIALGAGEYLSRRAAEHALGRVQFPGQMLDTGGRDGIAKLGAVKALVARVEAWRLLLETLFLRGQRAHGAASPLFLELCAAVAARAFGPEPGCMAYDAGQVFGGFAYSEDDLLSRSYRDSSLFRFLAPGYGAAARFADLVRSQPLGAAVPELSAPDLRDAPLDRLAEPLAALHSRFAGLSPDADPALTGEAASVIVGVGALASRIHLDLEQGRSSEKNTACAEVLLHLAEEALMAAELSTGRGSVLPTDLFPLVPTGTPRSLDLDYEGFCSLRRRPHRSADFLVSVFDRSPRYVPEMMLHDARLRTRWNELATWFRENCRDRAWDGRSFERAVEAAHAIPPSVIAAVKEKRWLATSVPRADDGLGWHKAEYYILNAAAGGFGDAGICLLIMASTSIGTTPVQLGLNDELPRVREELEPLVADSRRLGEIAGGLGRLVRSFATPNPGKIKRDYEALMRLVDNRIRKTRVVKYLAANFLKAFYGAGIAGRRGDFGGFTTGLNQARELFEKIMPDVRAALDELPRRERSLRLFLRALGHGGVAAFALTEPTAGSDSGGVKTTARRGSAPLEPLADGRFAFAVDGGRRHLIDADRVVFTGEGMAYRTPDDGVALIRFDKYDYATDQGARYYVHAGRECEFHDIGQIRRTDAGPVYEFFSLTGAKMWITNGSLATQFSLYAQSPEGVTGFVVDRHAEGLKVGADEKKTGQRGSPTNEISLDNVRVPREAVIGYEGHGQVNALETLNVGRCGLAVVSGALMHKLMDEALRATQPSPERDRLLGEAAAILFGSESLSYYLIGLFDGPHESVRMESAIAKFACSEDIHEAISLLERAYGPEGQTERRLLEKARRDSRILTIYEGTNEVQRFLILKDLIAMAPDWPELPEGIPERPEDRAAAELAHWKNRMRSSARRAAALLGDSAWSDAMLQPALFPLADMAAEVLRLECILHRREWIERHAALFGPEFLEFDASYCCGLPAPQSGGATYGAAMLRAGARAAERARARLLHLDRVLFAGLEALGKNRTMPEVTAADALFEELAAPAPVEAARNAPLTGPVRILAILRPVAALSPSPRLDRGALHELLWEPDPRDSAALAAALALAAGNERSVVDVLMPGFAVHETVLRACGAGAGSLVRLNVPPDAAPAAIAGAVRDLEAGGRYDLVVLGSKTRAGDGALGPYLAGALGRPYRSLEGLSPDQGGSGIGAASLPAVAVWTEPAGKEQAPIGALVDGAVAGIDVREPSLAVQSPFYGKSGGAAAARTTATSVRGAADLLIAYAAAIKSSSAVPYEGPVPDGALTSGDAVWCFVDPSAARQNLAALRAARAAAGLFGKPANAVIAAPKNEWPALAGLARANGADRAFCVNTGSGALSAAGRAELIKSVVAASPAAMLFANAAWSAAFGASAGAMKPAGAPLLTDALEVRPDPSGFLAVVASVYEGKLVRTDRIGAGAAFVTMADEAELPPVQPRPAFTVAAVGPELSAGLTAPLPPAPEPTLAQAEVIVDLGYGLRDRSGMELAQELKTTLEGMGLAPMFGATRKVTQDLKLLPLDAQIGQTGVRVNPKLIIALGISGAPQHIDWVGSRCDILCFNKDPEAPLMRLNQAQPVPRVHPIAGDLFVTVKELIGLLKAKK